MRRFVLGVAVYVLAAGAGIALAIARLSRDVDE
jgi:hypothetical protein